jgi:iron(III) transport system substrate-binding protein
LTDPKWKGRVVHANPAASSSAYAALVTWVEIGGWDLVEALAKNQIIVNSSSIPFTQVGQGENALGVTYEEGAFKWIPSGNVGIVYPKDGMALLPGGLFLIRDSPNPINAKLFADFVLAHPQQSALATEFLGRRPTHKDVKLNPAMVRVDELNLMKYPMEDAISKKKEYLAKWKKVMMRTR